MNVPFLELKDLHKTYFKKKKPLKKAVRGLSFSLEKGEIFGLLGVNGAGKTTLSGILSGTHPPTSGDLLWNGKSIYDDITSYRRIVGLCPQKPNIDPNLTLEETLYFSGLCFGQTKQEVLERRAYLIELLHLGSYAKSTAKELSGGYKQRFLLARALMHHPQFVILDEPTVGLDAHIRRQLWEIIQGLKEEGVTVVITTHYLEEAEILSDRVCFIHQGLLKALDTPANLNKSYGMKNLEEVFLLLTEEEES